MLVGYDCETYPFAPGRQAPRLVCGSFYENGRGYVLLRGPALDRLAGFLGDLSVELVGLNLAFDLAVACSEDPARFFPLVFGALDAGRICDVGLWEKLRSIRLGRLRSDPELGNRPPSFSLAELERKYLKIDRSTDKKSPDSWRLRYGELDGVPVDSWPPAALSYCLADARTPVEIWQLQSAEREPSLYRDMVRQDFAFRLMSARGVRTDPEAVDRLSERLRSSLAAATPQLVEAGILRANGTENTRETKLRVFRELAEKTPLTATGKKLEKEGELTPEQREKYAQTSANVLEKCRSDPALVLWDSVRRDRKELSDFVPKLAIGTELPINARYNVSVSSFRSSCSGPNLQQQPRRSGVRECFVPRAGYLFAACDYHGAELCSLAQVLLDLFECSAMAKELQRGRDLHLVFAAQLAGIPYKAADLSDPRIRELRQAAKVANFGIPGGLGAEKLRDFARGYGVSLTLESARQLREDWLESFPEMRRYFDWVGSQAMGGRFTHIHPRTGFERGDVGFCDGSNQGFQHLTAAGAKNALYAVARECYSAPGSPLYGSYPVFFIHDEIIIETPELGAPEAAERLSELMISEMRRFTPDIPCQASPALMRRWYKGAETRRDRGGRLIPWEPQKGPKVDFDGV